MTAKPKESKPRAVRILRDGQLLVTVRDADAAFIWMVRNTYNSVAYAIRYDGYTFAYADNGKAPPGFRREDFGSYVVAAKAGK